MTSRSLSKRFLTLGKWLVITLASLFLLVALVRLGLLLTGVSPAWLSAITHHVRHSPVLIVFRYGLYGLLAWCWTPLLKHYIPELPNELIARSRRLLLITLVAYDAMCWWQYFTH